MFLSVLLIVIAAGHIAKPYIDKYLSERDFRRLSKEAVKKSKNMEEDWWYKDVQIDFKKLKQQNPEIIGWIRFDHLENTPIDYPILYSGDNEKYLRKDIHGNYHIAGCVFLEGMNHPDFLDYYNILYGHNLKNGVMFGSLKQYREYEFWKENQYFTVYTEDKIYRYQIFSAEHADVYGSVFQVGYQPGEEYKKFIDQMVKDSDIDTGIYPKDTDQIMTLSTCTGNGYEERMTVHAVCIEVR